MARSLSSWCSRSNAADLKSRSAERRSCFSFSISSSVSWQTFINEAGSASALGIASLLLRDDRLLFVELADGVVLLAPAHLIVFYGENVEAYPPSLATGASSILRMPKAMDLSFGHQLLIAPNINNPVVDVLKWEPDSQLQLGMANTRYRCPLSPHSRTPR